jgi:hypothetical protein
MAQTDNSTKIAALVTDQHQNLIGTKPEPEKSKAIEPRAEVSKITNTPTGVIASLQAGEIAQEVKAESLEKTSLVTTRIVLELDETVSKNKVILKQKSDVAQVVVPDSTLVNTYLTEDYNQWFGIKIDTSQKWLVNADKNNVSIHVMIRNKMAAGELVRFLKNG